MSGQGPGVIPCPYCATPMDCDTVDIGIGFQQSGPYHCVRCEASEIGPEMESALGLDKDERRTGFYKRGRLSPHANTIGGKLVGHEVARAAYRAGILDPKPEPEGA